MCTFIKATAVVTVFLLVMLLTGCGSSPPSVRVQTTCIQIQWDTEGKPMLVQAPNSTNDPATTFDPSDLLAYIIKDQYDGFPNTSGPALVIANKNNASTMRTWPLRSYLNYKFGRESAISAISFRHPTTADAVGSTLSVVTEPSYRVVIWGDGHTPLDLIVEFKQ